MDATRSRLAPTVSSILRTGTMCSCPRFSPGPQSTYRNYAQDQLLPCDWNRVLFNKGVKAPAGHIVRTDRHGNRWEMIAGGFRNPYGLAFNPDGELFVFDADMEWDEGTPWYRPTGLTMSSPVATTAGGRERQVAGLFSGQPAKQSRYRVGLADCHRFRGEQSFSGSLSKCAVHPRLGVRENLRRSPYSGRASYHGRFEEFVTGRPLNVTGADFGPTERFLHDRWPAYPVWPVSSSLYRETEGGGGLPALGQTHLEAAKQSKSCAAVWKFS